MRDLNEIIDEMADDIDRTFNKLDRSGLHDKHKFVIAISFDLERRLMACEGLCPFWMNQQTRESKLFGWPVVFDESKKGDFYQILVKI